MAAESVIVRVELCLEETSALGRTAAEDALRCELRGRGDGFCFRAGDLRLDAHGALQGHARFCRVTDIELDGETLAEAGISRVATEAASQSSSDSEASQAARLARGEVLAATAELDIYVFRLHGDGPEQDMLDGEEELAACTLWNLPAEEMRDQWDSLVLDGRVKQKLLDYAASSILFATCGVAPTAVTSNRLILLHGPPGTGKTTLCRALAQRLSIRLSQTYATALLVEVNAHSLFSKWFSESGKLVAKLFQYVVELAEDPNQLIVLLVDEVESLAASRSAAMSGNEPSDAVRVVNAVITQLDALKAFPNVLTVTTSNLLDGIDPAFVDRADLKLFLGPPSAPARYDILASCLRELARVGIIRPAVDFLPRATVFGSAFAEACDTRDKENRHGLGTLHGNGAHPSPFDPAFPPKPAVISLGSVEALSVRLRRTADACEGFSGRALRKLPLQAHSFFVRRPTCTTARFLDALDASIAELQGTDDVADPEQTEGGSVRMEM